MFDLPLHPAVVHLPLAGAFFVPLIALFILVKKGSKDSWLLGVGLQAVVLLSALFALRTGEADEDRVEDVVGESLIHAHEEAAELFTLVIGVTLAVWVVGLLARSDKLRRGLAGAAAVAGLLGLLAGLRVGHLGGELVYEHGAAAVWASEGGNAPRAAGEGRSRHHDEDEDEDDD